MREVLRFVPDRASSVIGRLVILEDTNAKMAFRFDPLDEVSTILYAIAYSNQDPSDEDFPTELTHLEDDLIEIDKTLTRFAMLTVQFSNPDTSEFLSAHILISRFFLKVSALRGESPIVEYGHGYLIEVGPEEYELTPNREEATHAFIDVGGEEWEIVPIEEFDGSVLLRVISGNIYEGI